MKNPLGLVLVIVGVVLLIFGISAADSLSSSFSRLFDGLPSDKAIWLIAGGVAAIALGGVFSWRASRG